MSCDFAVWYPYRRLSHAAAGELYAGLCEGTAAHPPAHPAIESFYAELTAQHPEIGDVPEDRREDKDYCPWSIEFDRSPGHLIMCSVWSRADHTGGLIAALARKHGLAFYDPQSERVTYPDAEPAPSKPWWKRW